MGRGRFTIRASRFTPLVAIILGAIGAGAVPSAAQVIRDVNCDGRVDDGDRPALVQMLFGIGAPCAAADINRDRLVSAADLIAFAAGPRVTFVGIASPDGRPAPLLGTLEDGAPVYFNNAGFGFLLVVEAAPSANGSPIGTTIFDSEPGDPRRRPDLQILADQVLGDGSRAVCDEFGIPAVDPQDFAVTQVVSDSLNDLACRFVVATTRNSTCTQNALGQLDFVHPSSRAQYCLPVSSLIAFPTRETRLSVQIRDQSGLLGPMQPMVLQVGSGPMPSTFTPRPPTATPTAIDTPSPTASASVTRTPSATRPPTATVSFAPASPSRTRTRTPTGAATPTRTIGGPTATPTRTHTGPTVTRTRTRTATRTPTGGGATPTRTRTPTGTGPAPTPTRTRTASPSPSPTTGAANGPVITFLGLTRADDILLEPSGMQGDIPIYTPLFGYGFSIVVEAMPGPSRVPVAKATFIDGSTPDLQIQVTRPLGNGSTVVCDDTPPMIGGVPAIDPPTFSDEPSVADRLNDLGCRFIDGAGDKVARSCAEDAACVLGIDGQFGCVAANTTAQFCGFIGQILAFPSGEDTLVTVRVRDNQGSLGPGRQLIVRVP